MRMTVPNPDGTTVIEVAARTTTCVVEGCGGAVVRHSLGAGQSIERCTRCFRRYQLRVEADRPNESRLRRMLDDFVNWQDE
jgi:hypothetical protein